MLDLWTLQGSDGHIKQQQGHTSSWSFSTHTASPDWWPWKATSSNLRALIQLCSTWPSMQLWNSSVMGLHHSPAGVITVCDHSHCKKMSLLYRDETFSCTTCTCWPPLLVVPLWRHSHSLCSFPLTIQIIWWISVRRLSLLFFRMKRAVSFYPPSQGRFSSPFFRQSVHVFFEL